MGSFIVGRNILQKLTCAFDFHILCILNNFEYLYWIFKRQLKTSILTLEKLTKITALDDFEYLKYLFLHFKDTRKRKVLLLLDEVNVFIDIYGVGVFGRSINKPIPIATTVFNFMKCQFIS